MLTRSRRFRCLPEVAFAPAAARVACAVAGVWLCTVPAGAQVNGGTRRGASTAYEPAGSSFQPTCGSARAPNYVFAAGVSEYGCRAFGVDTRARASAVDGRIGALATAATAPGASAEIGITAWTADANTQWEDRLTFAGPLRPATVDLTVRWDGQLRASADVTAPLFSIISGANVAYDFLARLPELPERGLVAEYRSGAGVTASRVFGASNVKDVNDVRTFTISVGSAQFLDLEYSFIVSAGLSTDLSAPGAVPAASAAADFARTGEIAGLVFRDAAGRDITGEVSYAFANGTQVAAPTTVPEPGTWALLGAGVLAAGGASRRRRSA